MLSVEVEFYRANRAIALFGEDGLGFSVNVLHFFAPIGMLVGVRWRLK